MDTGVRVVLVTVPHEAAGKELALRLVEDRLVACGNILPGLTSVYRWDGEVQQEPETLVLFKTTEDRLPALKVRVAELHPYEVPELLALPVIDGHPPYLQWVTGEVGEPEDPR